MPINIHQTNIFLYFGNYLCYSKEKVYILSVWQGVFDLIVPRLEDNTILNTTVSVSSAKFVEC